MFHGICLTVDSIPQFQRKIRTRIKHVAFVGNRVIKGATQISEDKYKDKDLEDDGDVTSKERATQLTVLL